MPTLLHDLRHTLRDLRRAPAFTVTVALTLALGIGVQTAVFSALHTLLFRPLPYPEAERLVELFEWRADRGRSLVSLRNLRDWRGQSRALQATAGFRFRTYALAGGNEDTPTVIRTAMATWEIFDVLGAGPSAGRSWTAEEERAEGAFLVLSAALWQRRFGAAPGIVGERILLNEVPHTVLGVLPAGFVLPASGPAPDAYIPLSHATYGGTRGVRSLHAVARLADGVSRAVARDELRAIAARLAEGSGDAGAAWSADLEDLHESLYGGNRRPLLLLFGAGVTLLLIACTNVVHLLVARFLARRRKVAVRLALGARLAQLGRTFLVEGAVLSLLGALLGLVVTRLCLAVLPQVLGLLGGAADVAGARLDLDAGAVPFALGAGVLTTLVFALIPTLLARRTDVREALKDGSAPDGGRPRLRGALVVGQIALSMVLLLTSGLLLRSFFAILNADPGFDSSGVQRFGIGLPEQRYGERDLVDFHRRLLEELARIDGVEAAGAAARIPAGPRVFATRFELEGADPPDEPWRAAINVASPGFFRALRIPLLEGRGFSDRDRPGATRVVLVNRAFRETYLEDDAVGRRLRLGWRSELHPPVVPWEIVGVVGDTRLRSLEAAAEPAIYLPLSQFPVEGGVYLMRTGRRDAGFHEAVGGAVASIDADLVPPAVGPLAEEIRRGLADRRLAIVLVGTLALLGLVLTSIGIYGVTAFSVARRRREMAIRMALGARRRQVTDLVLGQGLRLAGAGILAGAFTFAFVARLIENRLYETSPGDPATVLAVAIIVCGVALLACAVPARRVTRISPAGVLRNE